MKSKKSILTYLLLIAAVVILLNIVADRFFFRLDFTADKRFTLSRATKDILKSINKPVTVTVYFSEDLPSDFARLRREFKDELTEYASRSGGKVLFEFINPNKDEALEQKAQQEGINPVLIDVREKDQVKQQKAYLGAVLQFDDRKEVIPLIQPGSAMEYSLSTSIKKLSVVNKPKIGLLQGHGENAPGTMIQAIQSLSVLYDVEPVNLSEAGAKLDDYKTLVIADPKDTIPPDHLAKLDAFLASGKNIYIAMNRVKGDLQALSGTEVITGLEQWLEAKGIRVNPDFVIDQSCGNVTVNQQQGFMSFRSAMRFPYLPLVTKFADHPATKGINSVMLQFASSINYTGQNSEVTFTPLLTTSDKAGAEKTPVTFNINRAWQEADFPRGNITLCGLLSGKIAGDMKSKLIVIADGDFPVNGEGQMAQRLPPENVNLMVNAIDWLSDDTGLIDLRTKEVSSRPIDPMDDGKKAFLKYLNFLLPMLLIIGFGFFRWQYRNTLRMKRMDENFV